MNLAPMDTREVQARQAWDAMIKTAKLHSGLTIQIESTRPEHRSSLNWWLALNAKYGTPENLSCPWPMQPGFNNDFTDVLELHRQIELETA